MWDGSVDNDPSTLAAAAVTGAATTARVGISRGQHAQQGGATAGDDREHPDEPEQRPRPIQTHHAQVRFSWNSIRSSDKTPTRRNATQISRSTLHHSLGPRGTRIPPGTAVLASVIASVRSAQPADQLAMARRDRSPPIAHSRPRRRSEQSPGAVLPNRLAMSLSHRTTRLSTLARDILGDSQLLSPDRQRRPTTDFAVTSPKLGTTPPEL